MKLNFRHCGGLHQTTLILWWYLLKSKANLLLRVVTIGCNCHQLSEKWGTMAPTTCGQLKSYFWPNFLQYNCPESSKIFQLPTVANSWSFCHFIFIPILIHPLLSVKVVIFWHLSSNKMKRTFFLFQFKMVRWQRDTKQMVVMVRTGKLNVNCFVIVSWGWRWHLVRIKIFCLCCHSVVQCPPPWTVTSIQTLIIVSGLSPLMCQSLITMQNWSLLVTHGLHHSDQCHSVWCQCVTNQNNVTDHAKSPDNLLWPLILTLPSSGHPLSSQEHNVHNSVQPIINSSTLSLSAREKTCHLNIWEVVNNNQKPDCLIAGVYSCLLGQ